MWLKIALLEEYFLEIVFHGYLYPSILFNFLSPVFGCAILVFSIIIIVPDENSLVLGGAVAHGHVEHGKVPVGVTAAENGRLADMPVDVYDLLHHDAGDKRVSFAGNLVTMLENVARIVVGISDGIEHPVRTDEV